VKKRAIEESDHEVLVERRADVQGAELYFLTPEDADEPSCKVALKVDENAHAVDYALWKEDHSEPSATGRILISRRDVWGDELRAEVLQCVLDACKNEVPEAAGVLVFDFLEEDGDEEGDEQESEDGDEDDEDDEGDEDDERDPG
jgi:hypothetical protein